VDEAHAGFAGQLAALTNSEADLDIFEVPGAFEIPLMTKDLARTGKYSAIVGCAMIVDGGIYRHEFVAHAVVSGLMQAQLETGVPVISVVLTPKEYHDTEDHQRFFIEHFAKKGREAADAYVSLMAGRRALVCA
jgi:6,7-dimethyl-8-ribityllumazine synthase